MRIYLVFPRLPPAFDGIGDYTAHLARELAQRVSVTVLTAQPETRPIAGVAVREAFSATPPWDVRNLARIVREKPPDWLVVQYNPFSYGRYGFNPWLPSVIEMLRKAHPELRIGLTIHEPFVPARSFKFGIMATWQRRQLRRLGHSADLVFCAIEEWTRTLRPYVAEKTPLVALPVGSNIPDARYTREDARAALSFGKSDLIVGIFGSARRRLDMIRVALRRLKALPATRIVYVGPDGAKLRGAVEGIAFNDMGPLPATEVSQVLRSMDLHLTPYRRGVSARRGAFIAGLQHGVPSLSTIGDHTDPFLAEASNEACVLVPDGDAEAFASAAFDLAMNAAQRERMSASAHAFHDVHFTWPRIAEKMVASLGAITARVDTPASDWRAKGGGSSVR